jgi:hypothetical protein
MNRKNSTCFFCGKQTIFNNRPGPTDSLYVVKVFCPYCGASGPAHYYEKEKVGGEISSRMQAKSEWDGIQDWGAGFASGVAWACVLLIQNGHMEADQVWRESNMDEEDLELVDPYDAELVRQALNGENY